MQIYHFKNYANESIKLTKNCSKFKKVDLFRKFYEDEGEYENNDLYLTWLC